MSKNKSQESLNAELIQAADDRKLSKVKELIENGANVDATETATFSHHWSALHYAARWDHLEIAQFLTIDKNANIHIKDWYDKQPLYVAGYNGGTRVAQFLLSKGASIDAQDTFGETALHGAAFNDQYETAALLLKNGADPTIKNKKGKKPSDLVDKTNQKLKNLLLEAEKNWKPPSTSVSNPKQDSKTEITKDQ